MDQKRPYLDVVDAVRSLRFIIEKKLYNNQVYNELTENATVREIVDIIRSHIKDIKVEYVDTRIMNQLSYHVLRDRFLASGFEFTGSLSEGIRQTVMLLRNVRSEGRSDFETTA